MGALELIYFFLDKLYKVASASMTSRWLARVEFLEAINSLLFDITIYKFYIFILYSYCHDLKEILWVTNFLLYLSNMLTTVVVKELRFIND